MSEIKLNLVDSQQIRVGTIHGSIGDACLAALSAEPETINELQLALERFQLEPPDFSSPFVLSKRSHIDTEPYDAGILVIDLAARIIACESTYLRPRPNGQVQYHSAEGPTETPILYSIPDDWLFLRSIDQYESLWVEKRMQRLCQPPLDARSVLYGRPLLEFLATNIRTALTSPDIERHNTNADNELSPAGAIHAQWLLTPREDLNGQSPRDVLLAKQDFIDSDLESRALQWSMQLEGPPGLSRESYAYRNAGFGSHEWVLYYELIRYLLETTLQSQPEANIDFVDLIQQLDSLKDAWLNEPNINLDERVPAIVIDNERRRLPEAMGGRSMVVDEDCPLCKMMGDDCEAGLDVCFWHLDGCNIEEHFAFSRFLTEEEYQNELRDRDERHREFDQIWSERNEDLAHRESIEPDTLDELAPF